MAFRKLGTAVTFAVCGLFLASCTPSQAAPTPSVTLPTSPSPSATPTTMPTFSAVQDAAASKVVDYYRVFNQVMTRDVSPNDLARVARGAALAEAQTSYNTFGNASLTVKGSVKATIVTVSSPQEGKRLSVIVSLCDDARDWQVVDKSGKDILSSSAKVIRPLDAKIEQWPDGWYVTKFVEGKHQC